ncbi:hypothetical protein LMG31506_03637 [Cupriavidus yeoncheonensis]|uniref:BON domain-containing protein n=1 Tax=Cupriavidus yeoncheonensis TaxID=1462994 RepID=A0A916IX16_9BURK|nr:BON domain-containing protein [Cupriavidus yeoncheonensis]CAG2147473.1 hypothetical protein LMG31506_03637 [Cupriavidus yeoncheonensis]
MNRDEYGDRLRYGGSREDLPDEFDDQAVRRQRSAGGDPRWQAGARQPANGWPTSPPSPPSPTLPRRGPRNEVPEGHAPPAPRDPDWRSRRDWQRGRGTGYGDERERQSHTQREEWGASRAPTDTGRGGQGYVPFAGASQWEPMDFARPEHPVGSQRRPSGPKGYHRPDGRIQDEVCERLAHSRFDVSDVEVAVADGIVTLSGKVKERGQKYRIEEVVDTVFGVRDVDNQIRVGRASTSTQEATPGQGVRTAAADRHGQPGQS